MKHKIVRPKIHRNLKIYLFGTEAVAAGQKYRFVRSVSCNGLDCGVFMFSYTRQGIGGMKTGESRQGHKAGRFSTAAKGTHATLSLSQDKRDDFSGYGGRRRTNAHVPQYKLTRKKTME